jgi:hypothetical protein
MLSCDPPALSKGVPFWRQPERVAHLRIEPGEVLPPSTDARGLRAMIESRYRKRIDAAAQPSSVEAPRPRSRPSLPGLARRGTARDEASTAP